MSQELESSEMFHQLFEEDVAAVKEIFKALLLA